MELQHNCNLFHSRAAGLYNVMLSHLKAHDLKKKKSVLIWFTVSQEKSWSPFGDIIDFHPDVPSWCFTQGTSFRLMHLVKIAASVKNFTVPQRTFYIHDMDQWLSLLSLVEPRRKKIMEEDFLCLVYISCRTSWHSKLQEFAAIPTTNITM
jgi:hypothetical protein